MATTAEAYGFGARAPYAQPRESEYDMKERVRLSGLFPRVRNQPMSVQLQALLKEFETYRSFSGRRMKTFRLEAMRTGFRHAWGNRDYETIIAVANKIPEEALQEDEKLLLWYDQALTRSESQQ